MSCTMKLRVSFISSLAAAALCAATSALAASATEGADAFKAKCATCHTIEKGGKNVVGPNLFGIVGQKSGQVASFKYSPAFKAQQITWTEDKLKEWFLQPSKMVPGTKMVLIKPVTPAEADSIVAFMNTKK